MMMAKAPTTQTIAAAVGCCGTNGPTTEKHSSCYAAPACASPHTSWGLGSEGQAAIACRWPPAAPPGPAGANKGGKNGSRRRQQCSNVSASLKGTSGNHAHVWLVTQHISMVNTCSSWKLCASQFWLLSAWEQSETALQVRQGGMATG